ncbi:MAG: hypothetical protein M9894_22740 [Planctomycetes bacterium]|nr:hypothetical protein [Planctomycetota bacterium]
MSESPATEEPGSPEAKGIGSVLYKLALAGVGALILAQEELEAAWKRTRGERAEGGDGEPAAPEGAAAEPAPDPGQPDGSRVRAQIDAAIGRVLRTLPIPTREEVDGIAARLDELEARADAEQGAEQG